MRTLIPLAVLVAVGIGFACTHGLGNLSAFGWRDIALLCPVGALSVMLAAKAAIPRALVSLGIAIVLIVLFGRSFCGWVCPVPVVSRLRELFSSGKRKKQISGAGAEAQADGEADVAPKTDLSPLSSFEKEILSGCAGSCTEKRHMLDGRHLVLGGSLLSAAIFGFPVFCLVCPVGLTFATVFLLMRAFGYGDVSWALVAVPAVLVLEVVVLRRWCHSLCPLGALMSLVGRTNRTFRPTIDDAACLESSRSHACGQCARACPEGIDPRHPERGADWSECTRCRACVEACPAKAIGIEVLPTVRKQQGSSAAANTDGGQGNHL